MELTVKNGQTLMDVAMEHTGSWTTALEMCMLNDISLTKTLTHGQILEYENIVDKKTADLFANMFSKPSSALNETDVSDLCASVGENTADFGTFDYTFDETYNHYSLL